MKTLKTDFLQIVHTEKGVLLLLSVNLLLGIALAVFAFLSLNPSSARTIFGYGDIGAYRDGSWASVLVFPVFALVLGVFHGLLALRIFQKRGSGMTKFFLVTTMFLILASFLVLNRTLGKG